VCEFSKFKYFQRRLGH